MTDPLIEAAAKAAFNAYFGTSDPRGTFHESHPTYRNWIAAAQALRTFWAAHTEPLADWERELLTPPTAHTDTEPDLVTALRMAGQRLAECSPLAHPWSADPLIKRLRDEANRLEAAAREAERAERIGRAVWEYVNGPNDHEDKATGAAIIRLVEEGSEQ